MQASAAQALVVQAAESERAAQAPIAHGARQIRLVAAREIRLLWRSRATRGIGVLMAAVAWLPPLLLPLRAGGLGIASFREMAMLGLALDEVMLPLMALMAGADLLAGEIEDGTLISLVTLPISRTACFVGKWLGRLALLGAGYIVAFGSAAAMVAAARGTAGWQDYAVISGAGLMLSVAAMAIGASLGVLGRTRTRAFGSAVAAWIVMVFALDATLLAAVVALAPIPPEEVGTHGHSEMSVQMQTMRLHQMDDDTGLGTGAAAKASQSAAVAWLMTIDPVDLFRMSALSFAPGMRARVGAGFDAAGFGMMPLVTGWLGWIAITLALALRRFRRMPLQ